MAFSDLEERKHKHFLEKHYAGARAKIEQKPYGAFLNDRNFFFHMRRNRPLNIRTTLVTPIAWFSQYLSDRMIM